MYSVINRVNVDIMFIMQRSVGILLLSALSTVEFQAVMSDSQSVLVRFKL